MFLLNLTWLQFAATLGVLSAGVLALYLWDRSKRRVTVPSLRFWRPAEQASEVKHRRRIQQPWSLLLQLLSMALLLLALAQPRIGSPVSRARDHVLILDTSAEMAARVGSASLLDHARSAAHAWLRALPAGDRVMLVRADALATPATAFERNRAAVEQAVDASETGATALNLSQAVDFARQAQKLQGSRRGEIVYAGAGHTAEPPANAAGIRVLPTASVPPNTGLRRIGARRAASDPYLWEILATVHNSGSAPRTVTVALAFSGSPAGARAVVLPPLAEQSLAFSYRARTAGVLEARLLTNDAFPDDDRVTLELPAPQLLNVTVYSDDPEPLRPLVRANPLVNAVFRRTAEYRAAQDSSVVILDRFVPPSRPTVDTLWIEPPAGAAPVPLRTTVSDAVLTRWRTDHPLSAGLRAQDLRLASAEVFAPGPDDIVVAEVEAGPVLVARAGKPKSVVLGFHPLRGALRFELTTPLLFANILRWMEPAAFRRWELYAGSPGNISVDLGPDASAGGIRVVASNGTELPYTLEGSDLRFFAGTPGSVRVIAGDRELVYSLALPEVADTKWTPPAGTRTGIPRAAVSAQAFVELWPWLALLGGLGLAAEWLLFGRARFAGWRRAA